MRNVHYVHIMLETNFAQWVRIGIEFRECLKQRDKSMTYNPAINTTAKCFFRGKNKELQNSIKKWSFE